MVLCRGQRICVKIIGIMVSCCSKSSTKAVYRWSNLGKPCNIPPTLTGIVLCMRPANERRRYNVTSSLIGLVHLQNNHLRSALKLQPLITDITVVICDIQTITVFESSSLIAHSFPFRWAHNCTLWLVASEYYRSDAVTLHNRSNPYPSLRLYAYILWPKIMGLVLTMGAICCTGYVATAAECHSNFTRTSYLISVYSLEF